MCNNAPGLQNPRDLANETDKHQGWLYCFSQQFDTFVVWASKSVNVHNFVQEKAGKWWASDEWKYKELRRCPFVIHSVPLSHGLLYSSFLHNTKSSSLHSDSDTVGLNDA